MRVEPAYDDEETMAPPRCGGYFGLAFTGYRFEIPENAIEEAGGSIRLRSTNVSRA